MYSSQEWWSNTAAGGGGGSTDPGAPITGSLRLRGAQCLTRAGRSGGLNGTNWCASFWFKSTNPYDGEGCVFVIGDSSPENWLLSTTSGQFRNRNTGAGYIPWKTDVYQRDCNAWYHLYFEGNTSNQVNLWVNGEKQSATASYSGFDRSINFGAETNTNVGQNAEGYLADIYIVQGQQLGWNTFARYNADGVIVPVDATITGDWGPNGVHLEFKNPNEIGEDSSPNNDPFTPKGFDADPNSPYFDLVADSPTNNHAGGSKIHKGGNQIYMAFANMRFGPTGSDSPGMLSNFIPTSGKFYGEFTMSEFDRTAAEVGVFAVPNTFISSQYMWNVGYGVVWKLNGSAVYSQKGSDYTITGYSNDLTNTSTIQVAIDYDTGELSIGYDNKWLSDGATGGSFSSTFGVTATLLEHEIRTFLIGAQGYGAYNMNINWGQYAYTYEPPAGFGPMTTENVGAEIINGREHFRAITGPGTAGATLYEEDASTGPTGPLAFTSGGTTIPFSGSFTGAVLDLLAPTPSVTVNHTATTILQHVCLSEDGVNWTDLGQYTVSGDVPFTAAMNNGNDIRYIRYQISPAATISWGNVNGNVGILGYAQSIFPQGLYWIKDRVNTNEYQLVSTSVGASQALTCPTAQAPIAYAEPSGDSVAWCWNSSETWTGTGITDGYRDPTSGFSMFKYSGTGSAKTVPHGLKSRPGWFIVKRIDAGNSQSYACYHQNLAVNDAFPNTEYMIALNQSNARSQSTAWWNATAPTNTEISLGTSAWVNAAGGEYICFAWEEIPGYSSYGVYQGNGNADGPMIDCGFKPAYLLIKSLAGSISWIVKDTARSVDNPTLPYLYPNATSFEASGRDVDFLSNGFKIRSSGSVQNNASNYHLYVAFAENPFNAPTNAR